MFEITVRGFTDTRLTKKFVIHNTFLHFWKWVRVRRTLPPQEKTIGNRLRQFCGIMTEWTSIILCYFPCLLRIFLSVVHSAGLDLGVSQVPIKTTENAVFTNGLFLARHLSRDYTQWYSETVFWANAEDDGPGMSFYTTDTRIIKRMHKYMQIASSWVIGQIKVSP